MNQEINTYVKYCPNVFIAKCYRQYEKGETILLTTKYGKENESIVFNLIYEKDGFFFYSIIRADGFNAQEYAKKKAERYLSAGFNAQTKSNKAWEASNEGRDFLSLGEPIKAGHHSERRHRALIERNHNRMHKAVELEKIASDYENRTRYWLQRENIINLSMPESLEYYEFKLEEAIKKHEDLKTGKTEKSHSYSLTYAKKEVNEIKKKLELAKKLWE